MLISAKDALTLKQDLTVTSDTLEAIRDGSREVSSNTSGGANTTLWSNYDNSNQNRDDKDAEITFEYATKMNFNQIKIFFRQDSYSCNISGCEDNTDFRIRYRCSRYVDIS